MTDIGEALRADDISPRVFVSNLNPGVVRHEFLVSMLGLVAHDVQAHGNIGYLRPMLAGGLLDVYRNQAVEDFIASKQEWMACFDSDMVLPPTIVDDLLAVAREHDHPFVAGLYYMALNEGIRPSMFRRKKLNDGYIHMAPFEVDEVPNDGSVVEVDGTGFGVTLLRRDLLVDMYDKFGSPMPWFMSQPYDGISYGEDFDFCMRSAELGVKPLIATGLAVGHVKNYVLTREMAEQVDMLPSQGKEFANGPT